MKWIPRYGEIVAVVVSPPALFVPVIPVGLVDVEKVVLFKLFGSPPAVVPPVLDLNK